MHVCMYAYDFKVVIMLLYSMFYLNTSINVRSIPAVYAVYVLMAVVAGNRIKADVIQVIVDALKDTRTLLALDLYGMYKQYIHATS